MSLPHKFMSKKNKRSKNKKKKNSQAQQRIETKKRSLRQIPNIIGAEFNTFHNDIAELQKEIDTSAGQNKSSQKRRILFSTEASYLHTGFSTYLREVMLRLHKTGKYELAELGSYGNPPSIDPRSKQIPWKYYHNMPATPVEEQEYKKDYRENQFGKWKLSYVLADFKPDIVLLNRDHWMDTHVLRNNLRSNCLIFWMPTVDGFPQKWEWAQDYSKLDNLFAYSWFGKRVLEEQSRSLLAKRYHLKTLTVNDVIQPGVDTDKFFPVPKDRVRKIFNINDKSLRFVGTVMRNQPRKLFPRIIESFRMFKEQYTKESENIFLLLHTSIPDVGWDIPEYVRQNGLENCVVYSYICRACGQIAISNFLGNPDPGTNGIDCPICKNKGCFQTPNTGFGYNDEQFNMVYNLMDVYVQGTIAEGDGMPLNEAKACGVPVLGSDYSAVYEKVRNGGGMPIKNLCDDPGLATYTEHETGQNRSLFNRQDLADKLALFLGNESLRMKMSKEARECAIKYYTWDLTAKKWEYWIDKAEIKDRQKTWNAPVEIKNLPEESPNDQLTDREFIEWLYLKILSGKKPDSEGFRHWSSVLQRAGSAGTETNQKCRQQMEEHFRQLIQKENEEKAVRDNPTSALTDPVEKIRQQIPKDNKSKILYAMPETNGDILISTGVIDGIKDAWPEADIYVATQKQYFGILDGNPQIAGLIEYHDSMLNYRTFEKWGPQGDNIFDIVFNPYIITQKIPHWIHNGHGPWLGQAYANLCNVKFGKMFLNEDSGNDLPEKYITVQSQTRTGPKDWDYFDELIAKIKDITIIQIGSKKDKLISKSENFIDLRGTTSPQQLHSIIKGAQMHLGGDSFPMHVAGLAGTPAVILFGGTYRQQGYNPTYAPHIRTIETEDRGPCGTSCHLLECEAQKKGYDKCINNITVEKVLQEIREILGEEHVEPLEEIKISSYMILKNGAERGFPFEEAIRAAAKISDEVVIVDGGSTDGTLENLAKLQREFYHESEHKTVGRIGPLEHNLHSKIQVHCHEWDMDSPTLFGDEKTYARQLCTGTHLVQLDADEIIQEPKPGMIRSLIEEKRFDDLMDLPCINFYENDHTIRIEASFWKWRISRNSPNIVHGVHADARTMDPESGRITMDKNKSDSCEYIYEDTLNICKHKTAFDSKYLTLHEKVKRGLISKEEYIKELEVLIKTESVVFHYSWLNLTRKTENGSFWDQTWHGRKNATHNTTQDIQNRVVQKEKEMLIEFPFNHPLKNKGKS